jgi:pyridoxal phosphate enzyme (YggS family)
VTTPEALDEESANSIRGRLDAARERIAEATARSGRAQGEVSLLLATKTVPVPLIEAAMEAGARLIGENRVQELVAKAAALADTPHQAHLIGPLQRNKARAALQYAGCIQTVADLRLAQRLSAIALGPLAVMIQVNTSGEPTKFGCGPPMAADLAAQVQQLANVTVSGFMTVGLNSSDIRAVARSYETLRKIRDTAVRGGLGSASQLSMGMSADLEVAIAEGATMVRLGSAVFGARPTTNPAAGG